MKMTFTKENENLGWDTDDFFDLSLGVGANEASAYGIPSSQIETYVDGGFVGDVNKGGSCNVNIIRFNPHGNGSHTECVGHISKENVSVNSVLNNHFFLANLISVETNGPIQPEHLSLSTLKNSETDALIIRTLPNTIDKKERNWMGTDPTYISPEAMMAINETGIRHLLVDLPSVDKEDDPKLMGHHLFWNYPAENVSQKTITELIFIPEEASDGVYLLNLQVAPFVNDASPCKPIIYPLR